MSNPELLNIVLKWIGQVSAAAATYGYQASILPPEYAEQVRGAEEKMQQHEEAVEKEFPKVNAYRKKHFQKILDIATGTATEDAYAAMKYMMKQTDDLWKMESALQKLVPKSQVSSSTSGPDDDDDDDDEDDIEEVKNSAQTWAELGTKVGFETDDELLIYVGDSCSASSLEREQVDEIVKAAIQEERAKRLEEYKSWPAETDCDRLDKAFASLEAAGIKGFHHITQNPSSANFEVQDAMDDPANANFRGYVWYHFQSTEGTVEGCHLRLEYGSCHIGPDEDESLPFCAIAVEIVAALREHGLESIWSGNYVDPIFVEMNWQRRFGQGATRAKFA